MKKLSLVVLTSLVALFGFQLQGEAAPTVGRATKARKATQVGPPVALATDLRCKLEAFTDAAGTQPLQNNGNEVNLGNVWVRASVRNVGPAPATAFSNTFSIVHNTTTVHDSNPKLTIPGGYTMMFPIIKVPVGHSGSMEAKLQIDVENEVSEINESNNTCTFKTKSSKLH